MPYYSGKIKGDGTVLDDGGPTGEDWLIDHTGNGQYSVLFISEVDPSKLDFYAEIDPPTANWKAEWTLVAKGYEVRTLHNGDAADRPFKFTADFTA